MISQGYSVTRYENRSKKGRGINTSCNKTLLSKWQLVLSDIQNSQDNILTCHWEGKVEGYEVLVITDNLDELQLEAGQMLQQKDRQTDRHH